MQNKHKIKNSLTRGKIGLEQKAFEIAEKTKNNMINFWNLFVLDNGKSYTESYKVIKKIGQGGCGEVFMVMHLPTDQIRAMKVVNKASDKVVKTIYDELNVLKSLDHPGIVKVFEYFQDDKNLYVVMEYLKGGSVFERMKVIGRFGERESAYIMK
jgi:calcium-dependent protein kinase